MTVLPVVAEEKIPHVFSFDFFACLSFCFDSFSSSVSNISVSSSILSFFFNFVIMVMHFHTLHSQSKNVSLTFYSFVDSCKYLRGTQNFRFIFILPYKLQQHSSSILGLHPPISWAGGVPGGKLYGQ